MITIVDYNAGNITSVARALNHIGAQAKVSSDPFEIENAQRIIFPGVGHAQSAMNSLRERGLDIALKNAFHKEVPIMGICLGTQIILSHSEEGDVNTLGLIDGNCVKFDTAKFDEKDKSLKIPHMGWNNVNVEKNHYILKDLKAGDEMYFVHSFYPTVIDKSKIFATCNYGIDFCCAMGDKNLFAVQFHPEKSGEIGLQMLKNFAEWNGAVTANV